MKIFLNIGNKKVNTSVIEIHNLPTVLISAYREHINIYSVLGRAALRNTRTSLMSGGLYCNSITPCKTRTKLMSTIVHRPLLLYFM